MMMRQQSRVPVVLVSVLSAVGLLLAAFSCREGRPHALSGAPDSTHVSSASVPLPKASVLTYEERQGRDLYEHYCTVCHGDDGAGDGFNSYNLEPKPRSFADSTFIAAVTDVSLRQIIAHGGRGVNKSPEMPAYEYTLRPDEIGYLVDYIRIFGSTAAREQKP